MNYSRCATIQIWTGAKVPENCAVDVHISNLDRSKSPENCAVDVHISNDLAQHGIVSHVHSPVDAIRIVLPLRSFWRLGLWPMRVVREAKKILVGGNHH